MCIMSSAGNSEFEEADMFPNGKEWNMYWIIYKAIKHKFIMGAWRGGEHGNVPPPPKSEKIVVENWCYFPRLYL